MWFSFWITVCFGVVFVFLELILKRPLPIGAGLIPAATISILSNGWEAFWSWRIHYEGTLCTAHPDTGELRCWDASALNLPDYDRPPEPPGWVDVLMPWSGDNLLPWLLTGVPLDLAAAGTAAVLAWLVLRPFGHHQKVDINPFD